MPDPSPDDEGAIVSRAVLHELTGAPGAPSRTRRPQATF